MEAFNMPDPAMANELQYEAIRIIRVIQQFGGVVKTGKSVLRMIELDLGHPRLPLLALTPEEEIRLHRELEGLGFAKHCNVLLSEGG